MKNIRLTTFEVVSTLSIIGLGPILLSYPQNAAKEVGSAAAPTAGLHFTNELLEAIKNKGINIAYVTLHVGLGTFRPVSVETIEEHEMHSDYFIQTI